MMSDSITVTALRQPKVIEREKSTKVIANEIQNVILTLEGDKSLVIASDAYHGIIMERNMFRCVFCRAETELDFKCKDIHITSLKHKKVIENYPHMKEYAENLIRKLDKNNYYCTMCNVIVARPFLARHIASEIHSQEVEKAVARAATYKPLE